MSTYFHLKYTSAVLDGPENLVVAHRYGIAGGGVAVTFFDIAKVLRSDVLLDGDDGSKISLSSLRRQHREGRMRGGREYADRRQFQDGPSWPSDRRVKFVNDIAQGGRRQLVGCRRAGRRRRKYGIFAPNTK